VPEAEPDTQLETKKASRHPDRLTALASGFVALMALAVSSYNVVLQRQQLKAQTWPHLEWSYSNGYADKFTFSLANTGTGPAKIQSVLVTLDGKPVSTWKEAVNQIAPSLTQGYSGIGGRVLGAGVEINPLTLTPHPSKDEETALLKRLDVQLCYCSVLGDCWLLAEDEKPVEKCPKYPHPFQQ
jgi:hypothetical protein